MKVIAYKKMLTVEHIVFPAFLLLLCSSEVQETGLLSMGDGIQAAKRMDILAIFSSR